MPVISIKMTKEDGGARQEQKDKLVKGITDLFSEVFNRSASNAVVLIEEIDMNNYFIGTKSVKEIRENNKK
ncbi:putative tautomerase [Aliarcobacter thereius]|uniref:Tautomerase n=2 Tax=Aliarcobacter thereius TaxID=544718 RepID=A0A1C0B6N5_9BACT|nr:4-oxalocrotonate tautomerase family protein [Aliarcobacter thereius]OCL86784.1 putative tautomerase [Aliarcobacter thereius]OCL90986.1 putative tautomerase [Aliarcobacter thereius]OCL96185.1 putative tautomerase [Aliarcobacter thereius LMG 24486]OCL98953.1 putative tautomerase [Aliarcobacter thereius]QBF15849.1 4-oxalocrotonate tautomerase family enzyme [Aliarcobacter thereius LMG 24486]